MASEKSNADIYRSLAMGAIYRINELSIEIEKLKNEIELLKALELYYDHMAVLQEDADMLGMKL